MGGADDGRLLRLTEHLGQGHRRHHTAAEHIPQHAAGAYGGQLVRVAYQHQAASRPHGLQQGAHQLDIHHAHLVHDDSVDLQRILCVLLKGRLAGELIVAHAQGTVDGLGLPARHLAQALGGAAGGCQQRHIQPHTLVQRHDAPQGRGLTGAGAAGQQQYTALGRQAHRLPLQRRVGHALFLFDIVDDLLRLGQHLHRRPHQRQQALRHEGLRLVQPGQIAALHPGDGLFHHAEALDKLVQRQLQLVRRHGQQLRRGEEQLLAGQEHVAVGSVVLQLIGQRRP